MYTTTSKLAAAAAAAVAALALSACGGSGSASAGALPVVPASAGHVHGMGVNPTDGKLYLGTHGGLLMVDGQEVKKVGDITVDLMGFVVVGPNHFLSSGHPGAQDKMPNPVGLIETKDGGKTWETLSLSGVSDLHTMAASGSVVYAFDGSVKSSPDGRTWVQGATDVAPASFAVDPAKTSTVLATTEHGMVKSVNKGKTFTHLPDAPQLFFLAWAAPGALWGVAPDGTVHLSADGGSTWEARGTAGGAPETFTAVDAQHVTVGLADAIVTSADGGKTFTRQVEIG